MHLRLAATLATAFLLRALAAGGTAPARTDAVMTYIHHPPESARDVRYVYQWDVLRTALEKTRAEWGPYRLEVSEAMTESRQAYEMENGTGKLTVMYIGTAPAFEARLRPVRIPVDRNLGGYCVFLVRSGEQARFDAVKSLEDLRQFTYGLGLGWLDVDILQSNGFRVVTGSSYDGLFEMLVNGRFDVFLRGAVEVLDEYAQRQADVPGLRVEDRLVLYYPLPMYFWFGKTEEGRRLAERAEAGMRAMIADGSYDAIFDRYQRGKIEKLHLKTRTIFKITNPLLGPETPLDDKRLWFDPATYH